MANMPVTSEIKAHASKVLAALGDKVEDCIARDAAGKADLEASRRAFGLVLREHLRAAGEIQAGPRPKKTVDAAALDAVEKGIYFSWAYIAKGQDGKESCVLNALLNAVLRYMEVPFEACDRAKKLIDQVLKASPMYTLTPGVRKFDGIKITLADSTKAYDPGKTCAKWPASLV